MAVNGGREKVGVGESATLRRNIMRYLGTYYRRMCVNIVLNNRISIVTRTHTQYMYVCNLPSFSQLFQFFFSIFFSLTTVAQKASHTRVLSVRVRLMPAHSYHRHLHFASIHISCYFPMQPGTIYISDTAVTRFRNAGQSNGEHVLYFFPAETNKFLASAGYAAHRDTQGN